MSRIAIALTGTALLATFALGTILGRTIEPTDPWRAAAWACVAGIFGGLVGLSELMSRYRDEPILASTTLFGFSYIALNALVSVAAFVLLRGYTSAIFPAVKDDLFLTSVTAGFGAMVIFRSKLFTYRSADGQEYAIGPAIVLETALRTLDQKVDRQRATERQAKVFTQLAHYSDFTATAQYFDASLNSFQNLSKDDKSDISRMISTYKDSLWPEPLKVMALGFAFLNIAGEENFEQVVKNMKSFLATADIDNQLITYGLPALRCLDTALDKTLTLVELARALDCPDHVVASLADRLAAKGHVSAVKRDSASERAVKLTITGETLLARLQH